MEEAIAYMAGEAQGAAHAAVVVSGQRFGGYIGMPRTLGRSLSKQLGSAHQLELENKYAFDERV